MEVRQMYGAKGYRVEIKAKAKGLVVWAGKGAEFGSD